MEKKKAVALRYKKGVDNAPKVVAKGMDLIAQRILEIAEKENIPIIKNEKAVEDFYGIDLDDEIWVGTDSHSRNGNVVFATAIVIYKTGTVWGWIFAPNAIYNDGLFDLTVVDDISILKILANLRGLYNGSFIKNPSVKTLRAKTIDVYSQEKLYLEVDGESLGHSPFHFEILPQTLKVIVG
jgi:type III secretion system FlhB-like substrate exporter